MKTKKIFYLVSAGVVLVMAAVSVWYYFGQRVAKIPEAAVKFVVPASLKDLYYVADSTSGEVYWFSTRSLEALDPSCSARAMSMGAVHVFADSVAAQEFYRLATADVSSRVTTKAVVKEANNKFYVIDGGSNTVCSQKADVQKLQQEQTEAFVEAGNSLKSLY